jgi:hypothetical protein
MKKESQFMKKIVKWILISQSLLILTACQSVARFYDGQDPCQTRAELNRPQGYSMPNTCGASTNRTTIYDNKGNRIGYIK